MQRHYVRTEWAKKSIDVKKRSNKNKKNVKKRIKRDKDKKRL